MAGDVVFNSYKEHLLNGTWDHESASVTMMVCLLISVDPELAEYDIYTDLSAYEVPDGGGYSTQGQVLTSKTVTNNSGADRGEFDAADVTWSSSTITAHHAMVYKWDTVTANRYLVATWDFGSYQTSTSGDFKIQWNASGIINVT